MVCSVEVGGESAMIAFVKHVAVHTALLKPLQVPYKCPLNPQLKSLQSQIKRNYVFHEAKRTVLMTYGIPLAIRTTIHLVNEEDILLEKNDRIYLLNI